MTYVRFFVLYWLAPLLKLGSLPSKNPRCAPRDRSIVPVYSILQRKYGNSFYPVYLLLSPFILGSAILCTATEEKVNYGAGLGLEIPVMY